MTFTTDISLDIQKNGDFTKQKKISPNNGIFS